MGLSIHFSKLELPLTSWHEGFVLTLVKIVSFVMVVNVHEVNSC